MTDDVLLRDVSEEDLPILFDHQRDSQACEMAAFPSRDWEAFLLHWAKILKDDAVAKEAILFNGSVAGYIASFEQAGERQVGYWIGRGFWGKGIATRALSAFLEGFQTRPLYAYVAKHNLPSIRVLEKCGFTVHGEGTAPSGVPGREVEEFIMVLGPED